MVDLIEDSAAFKEATVEKAPSNSNDIVNKQYADGIGAIDLTAITTDVKAALDDTYDLGSTTKKWAYLYAVTAIITSLMIGGIMIAVNPAGELQVNASINSTGNITAPFYFGDGSFLTGITAGDTNETPRMNTWMTYNTTLDTRYPDSNMSGGGTFTGNTTHGDNVYDCYGNAGCGDSYTVFNGSTLIIRVN